MRIWSVQSALLSSGFVVALAAGLAACNAKPAEPTEPAAEKKAAEKPATPPAATSAAPAPTTAAAAASAATSDPKAIPAPADVATAPADAKKTASGLATKVLTAGKGTVHPKDVDQVKVHYTGWTSDGKMFDSSVARGEPTSFGVTQVIAGWTEALKLMVVGEKRRMWIPAKIAYGETARPGYPAGQLTFDVELLEIVSPPETPKDVAAPPADAKKTASGLAYKVLKKGTGKEHPTATSRVRVHYSGWTKDGKMFDSSVTRGEPTSFGLNQVIPGWTEGVQLMVVGEKTRFWIPGKMAYGDEPKRPGAPSGQLTFDVELLDIQAAGSGAH
jgi:peptidylprolyl isomerase